MERRKCRCCGHNMARLITHEAGKWSACYTCLSCGRAIAARPAWSRSAAVDELERFVDKIDKAEAAVARQAAKAPIKPKPAEADRALKTYGLYCQLCETLTGKPIAKLDELLTAAEKAKRELAAYEGASQRYEAEIARLKEMAAEDILQAAQCKCPCNSCTRNPMDRGCTFEECEKCDDHCVCYECQDVEGFVWRGGK